MKPDKQPLPETVDREQFTDVMRKLITTPPMPKAAIPRKRAKQERKPKEEAPQ